ncbi:MAG: hypothetical protein AB8B56_10025 [Crocinitomicaceae bacterium]
MLEELKHIKISKNVSSEDDLDFAFLKSKGIEYLESMGSGLWSDFNVHDPGITFLELISYGITDLGNRMNLPIENLITSKGDLDLKRQFYQAHDILPTKPTTALDYRKRFSDIPGVRNAWIYPFRRELVADTIDSRIAYSVKDFVPAPVEDKSVRPLTIKGLNAILVDFDEYYFKKLYEEKENNDELGDWIKDQEEKGNKGNLEDWIVDQKDKAKEKIRVVYYKNRNLCEDLVQIEEVKKHPVGVCTKIELEKSVDEDLVHAKILDAIDNYFAPQFQHYSLKEMISRGYRTDEIFEGPFLEKGFIDPKELENANLRSEVRLSDLVKLIMEIDGVKLILDISIRDCKENKDGSNWLINVAPYTKPILCSTNKEDSDGCCTTSSFSYFKDVLPVTYSEKRVAGHIDDIQQDRLTRNEILRKDLLINVKRGIHIDTADTTTLQNELPETYGVGRFGLAPNASEARKAHALQLKGYLAFFDQILATYFSHLSKVKDLFSISPSKTVAPTYFTQAISDLKDLDHLMDDYSGSKKDLYNSLLSNLDNNIERRNTILDHLLARFAENFSEYTFLMRELYGKASDEMVLHSKEEFLSDYVELSTTRGTGYDVFGKIWNTDNVSGAQKRIARRTGISNFNRRNLSASLVNIYVADDSTTGNFLWKMENHKTGERMLNSAVGFDERSVAMSDADSVIRKLAETDLDKVEEFFEAGVKHGDQLDSIVIYQRPNGQYKFNVVDVKRLNPAGEFEIIGIFAEWDETIEELRDHLIDIIKYLKSGFNEEGLFLIEHVLMLPDVHTELHDSVVKKEKDESEEDSDDEGDDDCSSAFLPVCIEDYDDCCSMDPYSFKVSVVLPGYTPRFSDPDFRNFMKQLIQAELPSHIVPRICWIGDRAIYDELKDKDNQLMKLEERYEKYLKELKSSKLDKRPLDQEKLCGFKKILFELHTLHPVGRLHDCENEDDLEGKIILGRTNL